MTGCCDDNCCAPAPPANDAPTWRRALWIALALNAAMFAAEIGAGAASLRAAELETTHLFGFTLGTDVNDVGEKEAELENTGLFAKRNGAYDALSSTLGVKFIPFHNFSIEPGVSFSSYDISGVAGLDDRHQLALQTVSLEMRYRLLEREHAPFGLTFGIDPYWGRVDDVTGAPVNGFGAGFLVAADKELVEKKIFAAANLFYEPDAERLRGSGVWQNQSYFGTSAALTAQVRPGLLIGAETRYLSSYDGLALDSFAGHAFFIGPTFYWKLSELYWMSAAWSVQVAGRASDGIGSLDLTNFEHHQAILRFGYNF
jgi:hypothetical protein